VASGIIAAMGIGGWRVKKQMKHPDRGILQVTEVRDTQHGVHVTGIITATGIRPTVVEHKSEDRKQWAGVHKVPVMVDRADPSKFEVLWYEVESGWSEQDELPQQVGLNSYQPNATVSFTSTVVTTGPDGTTVSTSMSPEAVAHMEALLSEAFGQGGLADRAKGMRAALNEMRNQALSQGAQGAQRPEWAQVASQWEAQWDQRAQWDQQAQRAQWDQQAQRAQGARGPYEAQRPYRAQGPGQPGGYPDQGFTPPDSQEFPQVDPRDFGPPGYPPQQ
jgi:hypothetical protein